MTPAVLSHATPEPLRDRQIGRAVKRALHYVRTRVSR